VRTFSTRTFLNGKLEIVLKSRLFVLDFSTVILPRPLIFPLFPLKIVTFLIELHINKVFWIYLMLTAAFSRNIPHLQLKAWNNSVLFHTSFQPKGADLDIKNWGQWTEKGKESCG